MTVAIDVTDADSVEAEVLPRDRGDVGPDGTPGAPGVDVDPTSLRCAIAARVRADDDVGYAVTVDIARAAAGPGASVRARAVERVQRSCRSRPENTNAAPR